MNFDGLLAINQLGLFRETHATQKIVFTNGCFDLLHIGHVEYLSKSKAMGDILIVGLNSDSSVKQLKGNFRPIVGQLDRARMLLALKSVDYVVIFDDLVPLDVVRDLKPDVYTKGGDYSLKHIPEQDVVIQNGGIVKYIDFVNGYSSTKLIERLGQING